MIFILHILQATTALGHNATSKFGFLTRIKSIISLGRMDVLSNWHGEITFVNSVIFLIHIGFAFQEWSRDYIYIKNWSYFSSMSFNGGSAD